MVDAVVLILACLLGSLAGCAVAIVVQAFRRRRDGVASVCPVALEPPVRPKVAVWFARGVIPWQRGEAFFSPGGVAVRGRAAQRSEVSQRICGAPRGVALPGGSIPGTVSVRLRRNASVGA